MTELQALTQEAQEVADLICFQENHGLIEVRVRNTRGSYAYIGLDKITVAKNWRDYGLESFWATVIHEVAHFLNHRHWREYLGHSGNPPPHGEVFKRFETKWLHEFGMRPVYLRSYKKQLLTLSGEVIWTRRGY